MKQFHCFSFVFIGCLSICMIQGYYANSQTILILTSGTKTSIRGLSVVNDRVIWASGSKGMVAQSTDSGKSWKWIQVKGFEKTEFRDIEAFDNKTALIMGITQPAVILRTTDGGENWKEVFRDTSKEIFLDAMEFWNQESGIIIGDPVASHFLILRTLNGGRSWFRSTITPEADSGEACFASSGTNIRKLRKREVMFVSGGLSSHLFLRDKKIAIPILQGTESTGANSVAVKTNKIFIITGGDFLNKDSIKGNCAITKDAGKTWIIPKTPPSGYRSCIEFINGRSWITCGLNGVDHTNDDGNNFISISPEGFHVCRRAKKGNSVFLAGGGGRIAILVK